MGQAAGAPAGAYTRPTRHAARSPEQAQLRPHRASRARQASASACRPSACRTRASACRKPARRARKLACWRGRGGCLPTRWLGQAGGSGCNKQACVNRAATVCAGGPAIPCTRLLGACGPPAADRARSCPRRPQTPRRRTPPRAARATSRLPSLPHPAPAGLPGAPAHAAARPPTLRLGWRPGGWPKSAGQRSVLPPPSAEPPRVQWPPRPTRPPIRAAPPQRPPQPAGAQGNRQGVAPEAMAGQALQAAEGPDPAIQSPAGVAGVAGRSMDAGARTLACPRVAVADTRPCRPHGASLRQPRRRT